MLYGSNLALEEVHLYPIQIHYKKKETQAGLSWGSFSAYTLWLPWLQDSQTNQPSTIHGYQINWNVSLSCFVD